MFDPGARPLSPLETRVLGVLIEKEATTPDNYPLTLNGLVAGCNQKTSRDPVMSATEAEVQMAADALKRASLVIETSGGRVARFEHNAARVLGEERPALAALATLMLRGPLTPGEIRINAERIHRFADIAAVEALMEELMTRPGCVYAVRLPRLAGAREARYAQLLGGPVEASAPGAEMAGTNDIAVSEVATLESAVAGLQDEVKSLRSLVDQLYRELGVRR